ncbi:hypothetical protein COCVIDRAFT_11609 [Bipolaris victoriae FI3]|uniref:Uncharacterized protein n=1 Tax=Bipolaris victoriae (strain FI3) TaxID=930091 RepID=W7F2G1_BIPV3|nr:hypothetical protein COCVIDRAFT_11609 [Bipolaris victoriae FI3]
MSSSRTIDDVERQAAQESPQETSSVSDQKRSRMTPFFGLGSDIPSRSSGCLLDRTAQYCFLCLQGKKLGQYAVRVPCFRPTKERRVIRRRRVTKGEGAQSEKVTYEKLDPKENACENDAAIYQRLNDVCFQYQGKWKRWIPFYGVVDVYEVEFWLLGDPEGAGPIPVHIYPVNVEEIRKRTDRIIALEPDHNFDDHCDDQGGHSEDCENMMDALNKPCIKDQIRMAKQRMKKLDSLYLLKDCARKPQKAIGLRTLEGMVQESCIYNIKQITVPGRQQYYHQTDKLRGIEFVMGWQIDRIIYEMPVKIAWIWFSLTITWLCVIVWGGLAGDWSTAMAFGQLLVAFISLIFLCAKD